MPVEVELKQKHAEIVRSRAELLQQMEARRDQLSVRRRQQVQQREDARSRNAALLQDLQTIEDRLRGRQLSHPNVLAMETRYWVSVEKSLPSWESFLLGRGPPPWDVPGPPPGRAGPKRSTARGQGRPPPPKPPADL
ncbi:centrosomal protein 15 kDa [Cololabis saira]|uniref:centrosomal protein 15 kDa n=1 Tax=Cololabis saira TaxID=129043 RepID=UPI002AD53E25|nr:centrosomal protein 15 kDa [Cololabis saira]